jgi:chloramphenicol-sensitive protein RarD
LAYTTGAFLLWGIVPIFWKMLQQVPALEILAHRVLWGFVFVAVWMTYRRRWPELRAVFRRPRTTAALLASTVFIAVNWGLFIYAVVTDRVLATSLGYYINPLVNVLLGLVVLGERLNRQQWIAVGLAAFAVLLLTVQAGELPWISLVLPACFGFYSLLRKTVHADAVVGLTFETAALAPLAVALLIRQELSGVGALGHQGVGTDMPDPLHPRRAAHPVVDCWIAAIHCPDLYVPARGTALQRAVFGRSRRQLRAHLDRPHHL